MQSIDDNYYDDNDLHTEVQIKNNNDSNNRNDLYIREKIIIMKWWFDIKINKDIIVSHVMYDVSWVLQPYYFNYFFLSISSVEKVIV